MPTDVRPAVEKELGIVCCECGQPRAVGDKCFQCYEKRLESSPEYKSPVRQMQEELEATIRLEIGDQEDFPSYHHYVMKFTEVCGKRAKAAGAPAGYIKLLRYRHAAAKKAAKNMGMDKTARA